MRSITVIMFCLLFADITAVLVVRYKASRKEQTMFEDLARGEVRIHAYLSSSIETKPETAKERDPMLPEYIPLYHANSDLSGWGGLEDTRILRS